MLHDLEHEFEAFHERVDGDAEHAVRGCFVLRLEQPALVFAVVGGRGDHGEASAHEGRELLVDLEGPEGRGGEALAGEGDVDGSVLGGRVKGLVSSGSVCLLLLILFVCLSSIYALSSSSS